MAEFRRCSTCGNTIKKQARRCDCGAATFSWCFRVDLGTDPVTGKRIQQRGSGYATQDKAGEAARDARRAFRDGITPEILSRGSMPGGGSPADGTVGQWLHLWMAGITGKTTSLAQHRQNVEKYLAPSVEDEAAKPDRQHLRDVRLRKLSPEMIDAFYRWLEREGKRRSTGGLSPKTVRLIHGTLSAALSDAAKRGYLTSNPAAQSNPPKAKAARSKRAKTRVWTAQQILHFLSFCRAREVRHYALWHLICVTGLRRSEALALRLEDVDLDSATIHVRQTVTLADGQMVWQDTAKTDAGERSLAIDTETVAALRTHLARRAKEKLRAGARWCDHERGALLFVVVGGRDAPGSPVHPNHAYQYLVRDAAAAGLPAMDIHGLRHSYITAALTAGMPVHVAANRAGHSDPAITLTTYSHVLAGSDRVEADKAAAGIYAAGVSS